MTTKINWGVLGVLKAKNSSTHFVLLRFSFLGSSVNCLNREEPCTLLPLCHFSCYFIVGSGPRGSADGEGIPVPLLKPNAPLEWTLSMRKFSSHGKNRGENVLWSKSRILETLASEQSDNLNHHKRNQARKKNDINLCHRLKPESLTRTIFQEYLSLPFL